MKPVRFRCPRSGELVQHFISEPGSAPIRRDPLRCLLPVAHDKPSYGQGPRSERLSRFGCTSSPLIRWAALVKRETLRLETPSDDGPGVWGRPSYRLLRHKAGTQTDRDRRSRCPIPQLDTSRHSEDTSRLGYACKKARPRKGQPHLPESDSNAEINKREPRNLTGRAEKLSKLSER
jgi:hypothetical protein